MSKLSSSTIVKDELITLAPLDYASLVPVSCQEDLSDLSGWVKVLTYPCNDWYTVIFKNDSHIFDHEHIAGWCGFNGRYALIAINPDLNHQDFDLTLIHEIVHCTQFILDGIGAANEQENRAYLTERIFNNIKLILKGVKYGG